MLTALLTAALIHTATPAPAPAQSPDLSWMAGYWLDCSGGGEVSETWSDLRAGLMVGHAVTISARGRPSFEVSHIVPTPEGLAYVAQPNGAPPTPFVLIESGANRAVFENAANDFPTRILYERAGDALNARIEGTIGGEARSMAWTFEAKPLNTRCPR